MKLNALAKVRGIAGLNNKEDQLRVNTGRSIIYALEAKNLDITDDHQAKTRPGSSLLAAGTIMHSAWTNGNIALVMENGNLCELNLDLTRTVLMAGFPLRARMTFCPVPPSDIYFSDGMVIGYIRDRVATLVSQAADPRPFRGPTPAGQFLGFYNARLWVAVGKNLYFTDVSAHTSVDLRKGFFQFDGPITMVRAVDDGIYVSDGQVWFLSGKDPLKDFERKLCCEYPAIPFTDVNVDTKYIKGGEQYQGTCAIWASQKGVCYGFNEGKFINPTIDNYELTDTYHQGTGAFMIDNNAHKYVAILTT